LNALLNKYPQEIEAVLAKYPASARRSAVMPLLYMAQRESGYLKKQDFQEIAEICGVSSTDVASIAGFYTLYHDEPGGKYRLQVCTDLACALRGADDFLHKLCANLAIKVGETTPDGLFTIEEVTCLAGCDKAPMFQVQTGDDIAYHENQTVELTMEFIENIRRMETGEEASA
jgi:NADH-quinone oxidoreductase subunit E